MSQSSTSLKLIMLLSILNALILYQEEFAANAVFAIDVLCASRLGALEKQVSQLTSLQARYSSTTQTTLIDLN